MTPERSNSPQESNRLSSGTSSSGDGKSIIFKPLVSNDAGAQEPLNDRENLGHISESSPSSPKYHSTASSDSIKSFRSKTSSRSQISFSKSYSLNKIGIAEPLKLNNQ